MTQISYFCAIIALVPTHVWSSLRIACTLKYIILASEIDCTSFPFIPPILVLVWVSQLRSISLPVSKMSRLRKAGVADYSQIILDPHITLLETPCNEYAVQAMSVPLRRSLLAVYRCSRPRSMLRSAKRFILTAKYTNGRNLK